MVKVETVDPIGCFKGRGTWLSVSELLARGGVGERMGVVLASTGNFGQGVAYAGRAMGVPVMVFAAQNANRTKVAAMKRLGAEVRLVGEDVDAAHQAATGHAADFRRVRAASFLILTLLAACGRNDVPLPTLDDVPLPTFEAGEFCSTAELLPTRIEADPAADPAVWGTNRAGERLELAWPVGFTARRNGDTIAIAAPDGTIVARSGEWLVGAGGGIIQASNGLIGLCGFANWHR